MSVFSVFVLNCCTRALYEFMMREAPRRVEMRNERGIPRYNNISVLVERAAGDLLFFFSCLRPPHSHVRAYYTRFFFTGERPRLRREERATRWRSGCASHRVHRPARATERAPPMLWVEGRASARPGKVDSRAARRGSGPPRPDANTHPPPIVHPEDNAPVNGFRGQALLSSALLLDLYGKNHGCV